MKRRSFLALLGLASAAGAIAPAKAAGQKSLNRQLLDGDIPVPPDAVSGSWICPAYQAECERARATGAPQPDVHIRCIRVPASKEHCGTELQLVDTDGRVVLRQWNRK